MNNNLFDPKTQLDLIGFIYGPQDILINIALGFILGLIISYIYKSTHKGLSYSQSFMLTLVFVTIIVSMVMMIIGNNLARAFALVGALSIIRFRTVVKDTKDTAFVFLSLACGMAAGTSSYFLALYGVVFVSSVALLLHYTNYGSFNKSEFVLILRSKVDDNEQKYSACINKYSKVSNLIHIQPSGDNETTRLTFDIVMKPNLSPKDFTEEMDKLDDVSEIVLVASKHDVDY